MYNLKSEKTLHLGQTDPPPRGFNWDAWLGPAPQRPYHYNIFRSGWQVVTSGGKVVEQMYGRPADAPHVQDFLECVKSRKRPSADIEIAHPSVTMIHMANIAHRVGNVKLKVDTGAERFIDSPEANRLVKRTYRKGYELPEQV